MNDILNLQTLRNNKYEKLNIDEYKMEIKEKFTDKFFFGNKPEDLNISTMTITFKLGIDLIIKNIAEYMELNRNGIVQVKYGDITNRSLIPIKNKNKKNKKNKKENIDNKESKGRKGKQFFYNQVTIKMKTGDKKILNMKLFQNGSLQITGCISMENTFEGILKLFNELKKSLAIINHQGEIVDIPFVNEENKEKLKIENIKDFQIVMINTNFKVEFNIDRDKLHRCFIRDKLESVFDPIGHAGVNFKYKIENKEISIFIFEKGSVVITGAQNFNQVNEAYVFINKYLLKNYYLILKNDKLTNSTILNYINCN